MLVWIELLSNWIFLNQTMLVENLQQLGLVSCRPWCKSVRLWDWPSSSLGTEL